MKSLPASSTKVSHETERTKYRPDIDGLRAIAVLLVLLFHFGIGVPGGFIGVDVFFVISGYLITDVIRSACSAGKFSFYDFYARRLTRLHPALLATVSLCLIAGYLLMDPASLMSLASAAKYSILSVSNILFWSTQDYFDASAAMQPLLHTWSLSVEWQFYVVWPLIVWGSLKVSEKCLITALVLIAIISVTLSQIMLTIDSSASYFLMPFRGFELAIGALLVFTKNLKLNKGLESLGAIIGLITVITSAFYLNAQSLFPGLSALLPCIGAALCIQFGTSSASEILRLRPLVKIGVISYSVYLIHWPILVFTKYYLFRDLTTLESAGLLITSILAGQALYSLIEKPFISKNRAGKFVPLASVASFTALMIVGASTLINAKGVPSRISDEYASFIDNPAEFHIKNFGGAGYGEEPSIGIANTPPAFLLAGDSFAMQYASGMDERLKYYELTAQGQFSLGCFLAKTHTRFENGTAKPGCQERYKSVIKYLHMNQQPLVLSMNWSGYLPYISDLSGKNIQFTTTKEYEKFISDSLLELMADAGDRKVFIVGVAPFLASPVSSASCMLRPSYIHQACEEKLKYKLEDTFPYSTNLALKKFAATNPNLYFIDPADAICKGGICSAADNGALLFSDGAHLSIDGSKLVSKLILKTVTDNL